MGYTNGLRGFRGSSENATVPNKITLRATFPKVTLSVGGLELRTESCLCWRNAVGFQAVSRLRGSRHGAVGRGLD